jgi:hypothetical protein
MKDHLRRLLNEKTIFYSLLAFHIFLVCTVKFYPSMDGSCHLYNSNLIINLLNGNSNPIHNFFALNHNIVPNWISFFILVAFNSFLPAWIAEKIFILIYIAGFTISFRLLIKQLSPENISLSIFIFPFAFSFLFHLGFYNYAFSFILLFSTLYYWLKTYKSTSIFKYFILLALLLLTYFSAILTFFFTGLCLGLFIIVFAIKDYLKSNEKKQIIKKFFIDFFLLLLISIPGLVLSFLFFKTTIFFPNENHYSYGELLKWLLDIRAIIVFDYPGEQILTRPFFLIAIIITGISIYTRFFKKGRFLDHNKLQKSDVLIIPVILSLSFLFTIPNGSGAGMMSDRFCLLFYIFFIIWVSSQAVQKTIKYISIVLIISFHLGHVFKIQNGTIRDLNKDATQIYQSSKYIKENSIILPVNMSDNWIEPHFSNYLGVDKTLIVLENYEATVGWFPVKLNSHKFPNLKLGNADLANSLDWLSNSEIYCSKPVDFVFLYGQTDKINLPELSVLKVKLDKDFNRIYLSENKYVAIYERIK